MDQTINGRWAGWSGSKIQKTAKTGVKTAKIRHENNESRPKSLRFLQIRPNLGHFSARSWLDPSKSRQDLNKNGLDLTESTKYHRKSCGSVKSVWSDSGEGKPTSDSPNSSFGGTKPALTAGEVKSVGGESGSISSDEWVGLAGSLDSPKLDHLYSLGPRTQKRWERMEIGPSRKMPN